MNSYTKKTTSLLAICLVLLLDVVPLSLIPLNLNIAQAQEQTTTTGTLGTDGPSKDPELTTAPPSDQQNPSFDEQLGVVAKVSGQLHAVSSPVKGIKLNGVDRIQYEAYLKLKRYFDMQETEVPTSVDLTSLPESLRDELVISKLSIFDTRLIQSIENIVTPSNVNGAGHEYANVYRITKDHRTEGNRKTTEVLPEIDEEPRDSQHAFDIGEAVDVSELDYLRGTEFTIEVEVNDKGEPVLKDGKPVEKVASYKHLDIEPIKFVLQADNVDGFPGSLPSFYGESPHTAAQSAAENRLSNLFAEEADRHGFDFSPDAFNPQGAISIPEIAKQLGQEHLANIGEIGNIALGRHAPLSTGQLNLANASTIPSFGWYGDQLEGSFNETTSLLLNAGREVVTSKLNLPQGAMIGQSSNDIFVNIGERIFEDALGELPLGSLDGINPGNRESLEQHVGRGVVAKFFDLYVADIPLNASAEQFKAKLGNAYDYMVDAPNIANNAFALSEQSTQSLINNQISPDEWLRQVGQERLRVIEQYVGGEIGRNRRDAALNIEEKPDLRNDLENKLPDAPLTIYKNSTEFLAANTSYTQEQVDAIKERAQWLLDNYAFASGDKNLLVEAAGVERQILTTTISTSTTPASGLLGSFASTGPAAGTTSSKYTLSVDPEKIAFILVDDDLEAWLTDHAFSQGFEPDSGLRTDRFLAGDTGVFREIGIDQIAKRLIKDNDGRTALRKYLHTGQMPVDDQQTPLVNINEIVGLAGLSTRAELDAIFIQNAPYLTFENIGRENLAQSLNFSEETAASNALVGIKDKDSLNQELDNLEVAINELKNSLPSNQQAIAEQAQLALSRMRSNVDNVNVLGTEVNKSWRNDVGILYQVGQAISIGDNQKRSDEYRNYSLALSQLTTNKNGAALYEIKEGRDIKLGNPSGIYALDQLAAMVQNQASPTETVKNIGGRSIDNYLGVDADSTKAVYDKIDNIFAANTPSRDWESILKDFTKQNIEQLNEAAAYLELNKFGYGLDGKPINLTGLTGTDRRQILGEAAIQNLLSPAMSLVAAGSQSLDKIFGFHKFEFVKDTPGVLGLIKNQTGDGVLTAFKRASGIQKSLELLTGRPNANLLFEEQNNVYLAGLNRIIADRSGIPLPMEAIVDPDYDWSFDDATHMIQALTGQSIASAVKSLNIPMSGDFLTDKKSLKEFLNGNVFKDGNFWKNPLVTSRLTEVEIQNDLPVGVIKTLLNTKLTAEERTAELKKAALPYIATRLTPETINSIFGLEGSEAALTAAGVSGAISILLDDTVKDKSAALTDLGTQIADSYTVANFGFGISFLWDKNTNTEQKGLLGIRTLGTALGLDSGITNLAADAFETFFIHDGLNTNTLQGKQDLAKLITGIGAAAGVPAEYAAVASSVLSGDLETTIVSYAGQSFIDNQLAQYGVGDIRFTDVYEAFISPLPGSRDVIKQTAFNETISQWKGEALGKFPDSEKTIEITDPTTGEKLKVVPSMAAVFENRKNELRQEFQSKARENLQFAFGDALLNKALGSQAEGINVRGMTKAMFKGNPTEKLNAFGGMLSQFSGNENAALIFGTVQAAKELEKFFDTKDLTSVSETSLNQLDGWFNQITGWDAPLGSFTAVLDFVAHDGSTAGFDRLLNSDYTQFQIGGVVDGALGLPGGTTFTAWQAFESLTGAQKAVDVARTNLFNASAGAGSYDFAAGQVTQAREALAQAQTNLKLTTAGIVTTGVNLIFGSTFAKIDSALGLPSGLTSALISTVITAIMVPTLSLAALATTVLLPALLPILLGGLLGGGGLFGGLFGGGKKKVKRQEILWSYHKSDPLTKPKDAAKPDFADIRRADWPEEAWYPNPHKESQGNEDAPSQNLEIFAPGKDIALEKEEDLPEGIFKGNTKEEFKIGAKKAANTKIIELLGDLLLLESEQRLDDENFRPSQVCTHNKDHLTIAERRISQLFTPEGTFGSYDELIDDGQRLGVCFDEKVSLLVKFVHWQY
ncbi:hypothetical protein KC644_02740 [Candidatus Berkelbacteria bacterium]|nr:hypothetical protein [Candidatus Berkelbacteria bacterium]